MSGWKFDLADIRDHVSATHEANMKSLTDFHTQVSAAGEEHARVLSELASQVSNAGEKHMKAIQTHVTTLSDHVSALHASLFNKGSSRVQRIKQVVKEQLDACERYAIDMLHYNEPLFKLKQTSVEFDFCELVDMHQLVTLEVSIGHCETDKSNLESELTSSSSSSSSAPQGLIKLDSASAVKRRFHRHMAATTPEKRVESMRVLHLTREPSRHGTNICFPVLINTACIVSMACYNVRLASDSGPSAEVIERERRRIQLLLSSSLGHEASSSDAVTVHHLQSDTACGLLIYDASRGIAVVGFRGTKDPIDALTDVQSVQTAFSPKLTAGTSMKVHLGFHAAFTTLIDQIEVHIEMLPASTRWLFVGHSMGGALAQVAAAYYSHLSPVLVSFGMPPVGNLEFANYVEENVFPAGGLRVWNTGDVVPEVTKLVGYVPAGVPVERVLNAHAKKLYREQNINELIPAYEHAAPHVIFQVYHKVVFVYTPYSFFSTDLSYCRHTPVS